MNSEMVKLLGHLSADSDLLLRVVGAMCPEDNGSAQIRLGLSALFAGVNVAPATPQLVKPVEVVKIINNGASIFAIAYAVGSSLEQYVKDICSEQRPHPVYKGLLILETIIGFALAPIFTTKPHEVSIEVLSRAVKIRDLFASFSYTFGACDMEAFKLVAGAISDEPVAKLLFGRIVKDDAFLSVNGFRPVLEVIVEIHAKKQFRRLKPEDMRVMAGQFFT